MVRKMAPPAEGLFEHVEGGYLVTPGIEPYSSGVRAMPGYRIVHARLRHQLPYRDGFGLIQQHLARQERPLVALCAIELRSPAPFTRGGFVEFNRGYCDLLQSLSLLPERFESTQSPLHLGGFNPIARTNVAPEQNPPAVPSLDAFSYTVPSGSAGGSDFVVAGAGELRGGPILTAEVVAPGDWSPAGVRHKVDYVVGVMSRRMAALGVGWDETTSIQVYAIEPFREMAMEAIRPHAREAGLSRVVWHPSRPPIDELAFEMDLRGVGEEIEID